MGEEEGATEGERNRMRIVIQVCVEWAGGFLEGFGGLIDTHSVGLRELRVWRKGGLGLFRRRFSHSYFSMKGLA